MPPMARPPVLMLIATELAAPPLVMVSGTAVEPPAVVMSTSWLAPLAAAASPKVKAVLVVAPSDQFHTCALLPLEIVLAPVAAVMLDSATLTPAAKDVKAEPLQNSTVPPV